MDISRLFGRAWEILRDHKWLILLGMLVILGTGAGGGGGGQGADGGRGFDNDNFRQPGEFGDQGPQDFDLERLSPGDLALIGAIAIPVVLFALLVAVSIGLIIWVISRVAAGGMIAGVDQIESTGTSTFGQAWRAGWDRKWTLLGIGLLKSIPLLVALLVVGVLVVPMVNINETVEDVYQRVLASSGLGLTMLGILALGIVTTFVLGTLTGLADRACMLEGLGVYDSYRRAWEILTTRLGDMVVLAVAHLVVGGAISLLLIGPTFISVACCCLAPILWAVRGAVKAYFMTLWTVAWREWTGRTRTGEPGIQPVPGV